MGIGKKEDSILEDAQEADVVFSLGDKIFDHFENQFRAIPANKQPKHVKFIPRSSKIFQDAVAEYKDTKTMVVLSIGRVNGVEKLSAESLSIVADKMNIKWRVIVNKDDFEASKAILEQYKSANLQITLIPYGSQKDICKEMMQAHLVLMPSRAEPFGLVSLEAIAAGVPVLVSSKSGLADFIHEHVDELHNSIVDMDESGAGATVKHLAHNIQRMLKHNKAEFKTAARGKQQLLSSKYWEESHRQFIQACTDAGEDTKALKPEKDGQAQKILLEHKMEIQNLQETNRAREAKIEELTMENTKLSNQLLMRTTELQEEVKKLREKDRASQKLLLQKEMDSKILQLQVMNKDMANRMGELLSTKHTVKGKHEEEEKPGPRLFVAEGKADASDRMSKGDQAAAGNDEETWKREVSGNIGIMGSLGAGKATFINSIRGLRPRDPGAAEVGLMHATTEVTEYHHPVHTNIIIVDFPDQLVPTSRVGVSTFQLNLYTKEAEELMNKCDVFLVFTSGRIQTNVVLMAAKARAMGKKVLFVRSMFDVDIQNKQRDDPEYFREGQEEGEKHLLQELRQDLVRVLEQMHYEHVDIADVFIISGRLNYVKQGRWDVPALEHAILKHLNVKEQSSSSPEQSSSSPPIKRSGQCVLS
ncbi:uncharacterized protein LOC144905507 [Branchiostoma floridae x Branchiostoma belcheri]